MGALFADLKGHGFATAALIIRLKKGLLATNSLEDNMMVSVKRA